MALISVLALIAWVTVLTRGAWLVAHPRRQPVAVPATVVAQR